ncbi:MAG: SGNH/GDSL hydrolase family protein [Acetobacteraceae bacterium]|nr:SGNH/GDSL hydrolase family protein [Acetobacteraceae bacterium]
MPSPAPLHLPNLKAALAAGTEGFIVAIGSSSTEGVMATDPAHTYPAVLQASLSRALPKMHFAVLNRGIGGQDAPEELARLDSDVIALHPQVAIWQVGANGAIRGTDPIVFGRMVKEGVRRLQAAHIDVVLMDNQRAPRVEASGESELLDEVLARVATETGASLFSRSMLMENWEQEGEPAQHFISADGLHHNNRGYVCVARALADEMVVAIHESRHLSASR